MNKATTKPTQATGTTKSDFTIHTLGREHTEAVKDLFVKTFCDYEPITKHLGITYKEYEPFALAVIQKAVKDGLSVVAVDKDNRVIACTIAEDLIEPFKPNAALYPKMKPIFALIESLSGPFLENKQFKKGKVSHTWIAMVDKAYQGKGLSTAIDLACTTLAANKGFDFTYAEFTNVISENIAHHYQVAKRIAEVNYDDFTTQGQTPFKGVRGGAATYILGIKPGVKIETLESCYTTGKHS